MCREPAFELFQFAVERETVGGVIDRLAVDLIRRFASRRGGREAGDLGQQRFAALQQGIHEWGSTRGEWGVGRDGSAILGE